MVLLTSDSHLQGLLLYSLPIPINNVNNNNNNKNNEDNNNNNHARTKHRSKNKRVIDFTFDIYLL